MSDIRSSDVPNEGTLAVNGRPMRTKMSHRTADKIRYDIADGMTYRQAARKYDVSQSSIGAVAQARTWVRPGTQPVKRPLGLHKLSRQERLDLAADLRAGMTYKKACRKYYLGISVVERFARKIFHRRMTNKAGDKLQAKARSPMCCDTHLEFKTDVIVGYVTEYCTICSYTRGLD